MSLDRLGMGTGHSSLQGQRRTGVFFSDRNSSNHLDGRTFSEMDMTNDKVQIQTAREAKVDKEKEL